VAALKFPTQNLLFLPAAWQRAQGTGTKPASQPEIGK